MDLVSMKSVTARQRRFIVFLGFFVLSFALYAASEAGSGVAVLALLALMIALMALSIATG